MRMFAKDSNPTALAFKVVQEIGRSRINAVSLAACFNRYGSRIHSAINLDKYRAKRSMSRADEKKITAWPVCVAVRTD